MTPVCWRRPVFSDVYAATRGRRTAGRRERKADGYVSSIASDKKRNNKKARTFLSRKQWVPRFSSVLNPFPLSVSRDFDPVQKLPPVIIPVYDSETDDSDENGAGDEDDNNDDSDDKIEL